MREAWTDERLDDLTKRVDEGFERVSGDIRELRASTREEFASVRGDLNQGTGSLREDLHAEGLAIRAEISGRIDALQRTMIQFGGALVVSFVGLILAVILRGG